MPVPVRGVWGHWESMDLGIVVRQLSSTRRGKVHRCCPEAAILVALYKHRRTEPRPMKAPPLPPIPEDSTVETTNKQLIRIHAWGSIKKQTPLKRRKMSRRAAATSPLPCMVALPGAPRGCLESHDETGTSPMQSRGNVQEAV